jgi:hypothetical protein
MLQERKKANVPGSWWYSQRQLQEQNFEIEEHKEEKSILELQLLKHQQDYPTLLAEKEELYEMNKLQQAAIIELQQRKQKHPWSRYVPP